MKTKADMEDGVNFGQFYLDALYGQTHKKGILANTTVVMGG